VKSINPKFSPIFQILSNFSDTRTAILNEVMQLPPDARDMVFLGVWSVKDLIAHLIGWDFTNLAAAKDIQTGKLPEFYAHYDKNWKSYNAKLVAKYKRHDFDELLALAYLQKSSKRILAFALEGITRSQSYVCCALN